MYFHHKAGHGKNLKKKNALTLGQGVFLVAFCFCGDKFA